MIILGFVMFFNKSYFIFNSDCEHCQPWESFSIQYMYITKTLVQVLTFDMDGCQRWSVIWEEPIHCSLSISMSESILKRKKFKWNLELDIIDFFFRNIWKYFYFCPHPKQWVCESSNLTFNIVWRYWIWLR